MFKKTLCTERFSTKMPIAPPEDEDYVIIYKIGNEYVEIYRVVNRYQDIIRIFD